MIYVVQLLLAGVAAAFLAYLGYGSLDLPLSLLALIYWATMPFFGPSPRPVREARLAVGAALLAVFAYFAAVRILSVLRL